MRVHKDLPAPYPEVGDTVIFHDVHGRPHHALITCVHGTFEQNVELKNVSCVNLVHVSGDPARQDGHGRQTEHESSCVHKSNQGASGYYWRWPDEKPNPVAPAVS